MASNSNSDSDLSKITKNIYTKLHESTGDFKKAHLMRLNVVGAYNEAIKKSENTAGHILEEYLENYTPLVCGSQINNYSDEIQKFLESSNKYPLNFKSTLNPDEVDKYFPKSLDCAEKYKDCKYNERTNEDINKINVFSKDLQISNKSGQTPENNNKFNLYLNPKNSMNFGDNKSNERQQNMFETTNNYSEYDKNLPSTSGGRNFNFRNFQSQDRNMNNLPSTNDGRNYNFRNFQNQDRSRNDFPNTSDGRNFNIRNFQNQDRNINNEENPSFLGSFQENQISRNIFKKEEIKKQPQNFFRTASAELNLQNMKKNIGNSHPQQQQRLLLEYGQSKKSLGGKRNIRGDFVPPVKRSADEMEESEPEPQIDERLKNIDEKMIEMIKNEIMHRVEPIDWNDIAGLEYAKDIIQEAVVWPLLRPDIFTGLRRPPRGILLFGPPGTGKTLIGKCIASQSESTFFSISASCLTSKWVGESEKMVRALFAVAAVHQPSVIFIDEVDSLLCQRSESEHESSRRIKTEFLVQLDGARTSDNERILVVGATNRPQELDEAARRRFVRRLYIPLPEFEARFKMLKSLLSTLQHTLTDSEIKEISKLTDGYSGADMKVLCTEASMAPIRSIPKNQIKFFNPNDLRPVEYDDVILALERVKPSVSQDDLKQYNDWNKIYGSGNIF